MAASFSITDGIHRLPVGDKSATAIRRYDDAAKDCYHFGMRGGASR